MGLFDKFMKSVDYKKREDIVQPAPRQAVPPPQYAPQQDGQFSGYNQQGYYQAETKQAASNYLLFAPVSIDEAGVIIDHLKNREAVIVNLKSMRAEVSQRMLDFLSGAIYALDGCISPIEGGLFLMTPGGVNILQQK